eukprot:scaffold36208_cov78-Phaeocystis_antarctica.AAC.1
MQTALLFIVIRRKRKPKKNESTRLESRGQEVQEVRSLVEGGEKPAIFRPPSARQRPQRPTPEPRRPAARRAEGGTQRPRCVTLRAGQKSRLERLDLVDAPLQPEAKHRTAVSLDAARR